MKTTRVFGAWIFATVLYSAGAVALLTAQTKTSAKRAGNLTAEEGQRVFEANCSRCHAAPEGFSPRIAGTVVRHMRVRANLSREDEQKLLRFFNP